MKGVLLSCSILFFISLSLLWWLLPDQCIACVEHKVIKEKEQKHHHLITLHHNADTMFSLFLNKVIPQRRALSAVHFLLFSCAMMWHDKGMTRVRTLENPCRSLERTCK